MLRAKFLKDQDIYKIKIQSKVGKKKLKPQHSIRIKRNQCQPVNQIENDEEPATERHMLDTAESKGLGTHAINVQDIEEEIKITDDTYILRFELPDVEMSMGLPIGKHVMFHAKIGDDDIIRKYTPISAVKD